VKAKDQKFEIADGEATLIYRNPSPTKLLMFTLANSKNGRIHLDQGIDKVNFVFDAMDMFIKDWIGFVDEDTDEPVEYTPDLLDLIPDEDINKFVEEIIDPAMQSCLTEAKEKLKAKKGSVAPPVDKAKN